MPLSHRGHWTALSTALAVAAGSGALLLTGPSVQAAPASCLDGATPEPRSTVHCTVAGQYTLAVPPGTTSVTMTAVGAGGGAGYPARQHLGGNGAVVSGVATLPPDTASLQVIVGAGGRGNNSGIADGGGGSGVLALDAQGHVISKVAIAGAGGGGAYNGDGGDAGAAGTTENPTFAAPGQPAVGGTGGAGGSGNFANGQAGQSGAPDTATIAAGGAGGVYPNGSAGGGGGGGYGGGGGGASGSQGILNVYAAGGGGGSSWVSGFVSDATIGVRPGTGGVQLPGLVAGDGATGSVTLAFDGIARPGAPTGVSAVGGDRSALVSFVAPLDDGGAPVTGYTVMATPGDIGGECATSPCELTGLVNGTAYTVTVVATNSAGSSVASDPSPPVTPLAVPGAPTQVSAQAGETTVQVAFTAPVEDGGTPITSYRTIASPGGLETECTGSPCTVAGLAPETDYTFVVVALNARGASQESAPSNRVQLMKPAPIDPTEPTTPEPSAPVPTSPVRPTPPPNRPSVTPTKPTGAAKPRWYRDPLSKQQRRKLAAIPANPRTVTGKVRATKALHRTHNGTLAVPARQVRGHQLASGQGVQLTGLFRFNSARLTPQGRAALVRLSASMKNVKAVTCEGYADYAGNLRNEERLSAQRARAVCAVLSRRASVAVKAVGHGPRRPAMVGGSVAQRDQNRRVTVFIRR